MPDTSINEESQELIQTSKQLVADSKELLTHSHQIRKDSVELIEHAHKTKQLRKGSDTYLN